MLSVIIRNAVKRLDLRNLSASLTCNNFISGRVLYQSKELILQPLTSKENLTIYRNYNSESNYDRNDDSQVKLPQLIPGPINITFSILKLFKIPIMELLIPIITKDPEFNLRDLLRSTRSAASIVSIALSNKDYDSLYNLVDSNLLNILKTRIDTLTEEQRKLIAMKEENITAFMAYDLNITRIYNNEEKQRVEFILIGHYVPGFNMNEFFEAQVKDRIEKYTILRQKKSFVCNYVFSRDYCANQESDWIIKHINHSEN
ncbi:uncharacterized protein LOC122514851 [Polistes fuscatus]|uniref:uncharacterized protein LOC122514851 n=1 Tax=Polistes fuscatus TaxID=30207 RepID=UPI001CA7BF19|nr:uncharacterized protein LOC122514851 [Polistes fuscatus]